jgi:hypothetical protein
MNDENLVALVSMIVFVIQWLCEQVHEIVKCIYFVHNDNAAPS